MLKWTSMHKLQETSSLSGSLLQNSSKRRKRRATIANKENIPMTSTPLVRSTSHRLRNSPLSDIVNITPEPAMAKTPERRPISVMTQARRHSAVIIPSQHVQHYASTLPRFEEEYSPNSVLLTGQSLAMRGLLPDTYLGNPRYFTTPDKEHMTAPELKKSLPKKRKLDMEFAEVEMEVSKKSAPMDKLSQNMANVTTVNSAKMGDQTLDKLIDAILDSGRKDHKKKKPRRSFNLRRRTLIKNTAENVKEMILSPSYAAGDDPASDLSFLLMDPVKNSTKAVSFRAVTPTPASPICLAVTPSPLRTAIPSDSETPLASTKDTTFMLETPIRPMRNRLRENPRKKFKVDQRNYFEIGLALPSIYV